MRIPESVPPTIELENKSGIYYELIATVCTKGKKYVRSFLTGLTATRGPTLVAYGVGQTGLAGALAGSCNLPLGQAELGPHCRGQ